MSKIDPSKTDMISKLKRSAYHDSPEEFDRAFQEATELYGDLTNDIF
jgi:hypothetical protein